MPRVKRYLDKNVLQAAKERLHHLYATFDTVSVMFSGGKDSLATLHLAYEVAQERGLSQVDCVFRDEELIPNTVIDFVNEYRLKEWVRMLYFAVPLHSNKFILGKSFHYVQWDRTRPHLRPIPAHALTLPEGDERIFDQYSMDAFTATYYRGKCAFLTGTRAAESLIRYQSVMAKLEDCYICQTESKNVHICKPIYDWQENDIFRYFWERNIRYCPIYDAQMLSGENLRVSTPLHSESSKRIGQWRTVDAAFYDGILRLFPEMAAQDRYWSDLNRNRLREQYGSSLSGIRDYIYEVIDDPVQQEKALEALDYAASRHKMHPLQYPVSHIFCYIAGGSFKRKITPVQIRRSGVHG